MSNLTTIQVTTETRIKINIMRAKYGFTQCQMVDYALNELLKRNNIKGE